MGRSSNQREEICTQCRGVARRGCCSHPSHDYGSMRDAKNGNGICPNCQGVIRSNCCTRSIDHHWKVMPPQVKEFALDSGHLSQDGFISLQKLVDFWSLPQNIDITRRIDICGASWYLALVYMRLGAMREARALTINGAFVHQCIISSVEYIKDLCYSNTSSQETIMQELSCCTEGFYATESKEKMEAFIQRYLPPDYQKSMTTFANLSSKNDVMGYVDQISNDFHSTKKSQKHIDESKGMQMQLILMDDFSKGGERSVFVSDILSSTPLKTVFTDYAESRGVSLRSLRFSFDNQTLFLSQIGKKTPEEVGMQDQDSIMVHDTSTTSQEPQESKNNGGNQKGRKKQSKKKHRAKKKKPKCPEKEPEPNKDEKTQEELKIEHSKKLTKIHEELQPKMKGIRQRLNNLLIARRQPKTRMGRRNYKVEPPILTWVDTSCTQCISGKGGKSHFVVQVGEVQNLYKTSKLASQIPSNTPALDLHGYTKEEAMAKLDESLKQWVDTAMRGSYPFVIQVKIVCGCGGQILREVVQEWIKSSRNVSNAPKKR